MYFWFKSKETLTWIIEVLIRSKNILTQIKNKMHFLDLILYFWVETWICLTRIIDSVFIFIFNSWFKSFIHMIRIISCANDSNQIDISLHFMHYLHHIYKPFLINPSHKTHTTFHCMTTQNTFLSNF